MFHSVPSTSPFPLTLNKKLEGCGVFTIIPIHVRRIDSELVTEDEKRVLPPVRQPMVINHGPYGKSLYIGAHLSKIEGMGQEEGSGLIQNLMKLPDKSPFISRHRWKVHDGALWD